MFKKLLGKDKKTEEKKAENTQKLMKDAEQMMGGGIPDISDEMIDQIIEGKLPGMPKMNAMQKMALKGVKKMSPEKRKEMFAQAFGKMQEQGGETKEEMLKQVEEMRAAGQLNSKQYKIAKKRLGL